MKNIFTAVIIMALVLGFTTTSFAKKKIDVSERSVKSVIVEEIVNKWSQEIGGQDVDKIYNVSIVAKSQQNTRYGMLKFYVLTAKVEVQNYKFNAVLFVYTGEKGKKAMYGSDVNLASPTNVMQMQDYHRILAKHKKTVTEKRALAKAGLELAML